MKGVGPSADDSKSIPTCQTTTGCLETNLYNADLKGMFSV